MKKLILSLFLVLSTFSFSEFIYLEKDQYAIKGDKTYIMLGEGLFYIKDSFLVEEYYRSELFSMNGEVKEVLKLRLKYFPSKKVTTISVEDFYTPKITLYPMIDRDIIDINTIVFSNKEQVLTLKIKDELNMFDKFEFELTNNELKKLYDLSVNPKPLTMRVYYQGKYIDFEESDDGYNKTCLRELLEVILKSKTYDLNLDKKIKVSGDIE